VNKNELPKWISTQDLLVELGGEDNFEPSVEYIEKLENKKEEEELED